MHWTKRVEEKIKFNKKMINYIKDSTTAIINNKVKSRSVISLSFVESEYLHWCLFWISLQSYDLVLHLKWTRLTLLLHFTLNRHSVFSSDLQKEQMMLLSFTMLLSVYLYFFNRRESNRDNVWSSNIHRCLAPKAPPTGLRMRRPRHVWQESRRGYRQSVRISQW